MEKLTNVTKLFRKLLAFLNHIPVEVHGGEFVGGDPVVLVPGLHYDPALLFVKIDSVTFLRVSKFVQRKLHSGLLGLGRCIF